jgi:hypothetical protein
MIGLAVYGASVAALVLGVLWRPAIALAALLLLFALKQWGMAKVDALTNDWLFTNYLIGAIVLLAMARAMFLGRLRSPFVGDLPILACILYGYAGLAVMWSPVPEKALDELQTNLPYMILGIVALPMILRRFDDVATGLRGFLVIAIPLMAAFVFFATWGYRSIEIDAAPGENVRLPLSLAAFAGFALVVSSMFLQGRLWRYAIVLVSAALAFTIAIRTGSRGQFVAMIAAAGLFYPVSRGYRGSMKMIAAFGVCAVLAFAAFSFYSDSVSEISTSDKRWQSEEIVEDYEGRLDHSARLLDAWISDPWYVLFGLGTSASFSSQLGGGYAHILAVDVLSELGMIGFSLLVVLLWRCAAVCLSALKTVSRDPKMITRNAVIATLTALFFMELMLAFKQGTLLRNSFLFIFPVILQGVLVSERVEQWRARRRKEKEDASAAPIGARS